VVGLFVVVVVGWCFGLLCLVFGGLGLVGWGGGCGGFVCLCVCGVCFGGGFVGGVVVWWGWCVGVGVGVGVCVCVYMCMCGGYMCLFSSIKKLECVHIWSAVHTTHSVYCIRRTFATSQWIYIHATHTYVQNVHLIDINLVIFTIMILSRRLAWCTLQELQAHWNPKSSNGSLNFKRWMVVACTLLVIAWSVVRLIQQTSLFNLLFLFYPWVKHLLP